MELISKDTAIRVVDSGRNRQQLVYMMKSVPPVNAIEISEGATNGDMLNAMFPNMNVQERNNITLDIKGQTIEFTGMALKEWWDAPYKKGESE